MAGPIEKIGIYGADYEGTYGSVYDGDINHGTVELIGGGLDIESVVGDDLDFALFFDYLPLEDYSFESFVELDPPPLQRIYPLLVSGVDLSVGLLSVRLLRADTLKIGPVSGKPWYLRWTDPEGKERTILMGKMALNRM